MYSVLPNGGERFYLRLLLTTIKGILFCSTTGSNLFTYFPAATSYQILRTVNSVLCNTFKDACQARGLSDDDREWLLCLQEAAGMHTGQGFEHLCDDLEHRIQRLFPIIPHLEENQVYDYGLHLIDSACCKSGKNLRDFPEMPLPQGN